MSNIHGLGNATPIQQTQSVAKSAAPTASSATARPSLSDRLELSGASGFLQTLKAGGGFRADKVASIKAQIESGTYESDDKFDAVSDRLLDELNK